MKKMIPTLSLEVGMYLCTNIYDNNGVLLLSKDNTIDSERQLRRILEASNYYTFIDTERGKDLELGNSQGESLSTDIYSHSYEVYELVEFAKEFENAKNLYSRMLDHTERFYKLVKGGTFLHSLGNIKSLLYNLIESIDKSQHAIFTISKTYQIGNYLLSHTLNVAVISMLMGRFLRYDWDEIINLGLAGFFHDVGHVFTPEDILNKSSGLTDEEWDEIKKHPSYSVKIAEKIPDFPPESLKAIAQHHERVDGTGYPEGLSGKNISKLAQIVTVADVFDALTSKKPYNEGLNLYEGISTLYQIEELRSEVAEKFVALLGIYPIGTFVKLTTGEIGIVISVNHESLLRPRVGIIFDVDRVKRRSLYEYIDLAEIEKEVAIEKVLDPTVWEIDVGEYLGKIVPEELYT